LYFFCLLFGGLMVAFLEKCLVRVLLINRSLLVLVALSLDAFGSLTLGKLL
jgi:hypothetical protein